MSKHSRSGVYRVSAASVLIVDDDADGAELFALWLRGAGHRVSIVSDAERALILAPVLRPTVAVIDICLPDVDGIELVNRLRQLPDLAPCRYVAVTAYADARLPGRCRAAGFADFLEKPVGRQTLLGRVFAANLPDKLARYH